MQYLGDHTSAEKIKPRVPHAVSQAETYLVQKRLEKVDPNQKLGYKAALEALLSDPRTTETEKKLLRAGGQAQMRYIFSKIRRK